MQHIYQYKLSHATRTSSKTHDVYDTTLYMRCSDAYTNMDESCDTHAYMNESCNIYTNMNESCNIYTNMNESCNTYNTKTHDIYNKTWYMCCSDAYTSRNKACNTYTNLNESCDRYNNKTHDTYTKTWYMCCSDTYTKLDESCNTYGPIRMSHATRVDIRHIQQDFVHVLQRRLHQYGRIMQRIYNYE